jgi:hypothetical protein
MIAALKATEEMLYSWNASGQASKDLQRVIDLMSRDEELSVAQFCAKVEKALDGREQRAASASRAAHTNTEYADAYIEQLRSPSLQRADLSEIVERLKKDKKCRLQEVAHIANALTKSGRKYRSKKDAIQDVEKYAHRRLDVGRRMEDTSSVF